MTQAETPQVSVVITAHNEADSIRQTIACLTAQTGLTDGFFEVLLVDDRSTDSTIAEAESAGCASLRILHNQPQADAGLTTRQQALDTGFRAANGQVILTLDADCQVAPTWVNEMSAAILDGRADAVAAPIGFNPATGWVSRWQNGDVAYYFLICSILARLGLSAGVFFGNFGFAARRYFDLGGFQSIGFALTEDLAFAQALHQDGARIRFQPSPLARVRPCPDFTALVDRSLRISAGRFSMLAFVLSVWPLTLIALVIVALVVPCGLTTSLLAARFILGGLLVSWGNLRIGNSPLGLSVFLYEPIVFLIALSALWRLTGNKRVHWGGTDYGR